MKTEEISNKAEESAEAAIGTTEKNDDVNIGNLLEKAVHDTPIENWGLVEELDEITDIRDENSEVKAKRTTEAAADSPETKGGEEAATTDEIEEVKEVFNAADESSKAKDQSPSNDTEVKSFDIEDFKKLVKEREAERQSLKNKAKELEEALIKKTQELNQKIEECKSLQENEKEILSIYKELKESSVSP